jgi:LmbE family N-acetylglucosaminyl deacetylase
VGDVAADPCGPPAGAGPGGDLAALWGAADVGGRPPRLLGLFAHPDDEVFCVGGTLARCAEGGAGTAVVSLTRGERGQIRDAAVATRRTLGDVRAAELARAGLALGVGRVECLDLGDGSLADRPLEEVADTVRVILDRYAPDTVVTFGPDGGTGHPDHVTSCLATQEALRTMRDPPRLVHARFPMREDLMLDLLVEWLTSKDQRFAGTAAFGHALKVFADGSSMLGFAADHLRVDWFPAGSFLIEQGEPAEELFCILSGSVDVVVENDRGQLTTKDTVGAGSFVGEDGLASGRPRNAHVIARQDVTCLVLAPRPRSPSAGRGALTGQPSWHSTGERAAAPEGGVADRFSVDVGSTIDRKISALSTHRSQYALDPDLLPRAVLHAILGREHFTVVRPGSG